MVYAFKHVPFQDILAHPGPGAGLTHVSRLWLGAALRPVQVPLRHIAFLPFAKLRHIEQAWLQGTHPGV